MERSSEEDLRVFWTGQLGDNCSHKSNLNGW